MCHLTKGKMTLYAVYDSEQIYLFLVGCKVTLQHTDEMTSKTDVWIQINLLQKQLAVLCFHNLLSVMQ
jgi:hypothetical protein